jgi:hypothetical protein
MQYDEIEAKLEFLENELLLRVIKLEQKYDSIEKQLSSFRQMILDSDLRTKQAWQKFLDERNK